MIGARALDASDLKAKYLINIDSEEEGVLTVSCAGACRTLCTLPVTRVPFDGETLRVKISGLAGGHSGEGSTRAAPTPTFCSAARSMK